MMHSVSLAEHDPETVLEIMVNTWWSIEMDPIGVRINVPNNNV